MVLQSVNKIMRGGKASSLYCIWIQNEQKAGSPLEAIWIDSEMNGFERQYIYQAAWADGTQTDGAEGTQALCGCDRECPGHK